MSDGKFHVLLSCLILMICSASALRASPVSRPTDEAMLELTIKGFEFSDTTAPEVFGQLALQTSICAGIIKARTIDPEPRYRFVMPPGSKLRDVLNYIVTVDDRYRWSLSNGVLSLAPKRDRFPLLDAHVAEFDSQDATTVSDAVLRVFQLPDVQRTMHDLRIEQESPQFGLSLLAKIQPAPPMTQHTISVRVVRTTVRETLNVIVHSAGTAIWIYEERKLHGTKFFKISFIQ